MADGKQSVIYVVVFSNGYYSDWECYDVKAFANKADADELAARCNAFAKANPRIPHGDESALEEWKKARPDSAYRGLRYFWEEKHPPYSVQELDYQDAVMD